MKPMQVLLVLWLAITALVLPAQAQEMREFSAENGTFEVPVQPQRIITLNDQILAVPLYEMGVEVVGTSGRIWADAVHPRRHGCRRRRFQQQRYRVRRHKRRTGL
jgi:iron complex transport system substrate-binding protein